jgi:hypothetical protein
MGKRHDKEWLFSLARAMGKSSSPREPSGGTPTERKLRKDIPKIKEPVPDEEGKLKWQDAFTLAGVVLAVAGVPESPAWLRVACFVGSAVCLSFSFCGHTKWPKLARFGGSLVVCALMFLMSYFVLAAKPVHIPSAQENGEETARALEDQHNKRTAVELDCEEDQLPIHIQALQEQTSCL